MVHGRTGSLDGGLPTGSQILNVARTDGGQRLSEPSGRWPRRSPMPLDHHRRHAWREGTTDGDVSPRTRIRSARAVTGDGAASSPLPPAQDLVARAIQLAERLQAQITAGKAGRLTGLDVRSRSPRGRRGESKVRSLIGSMVSPPRDGKDQSGQGLSEALALARSIHQRIAAETTAHQASGDMGGVREGGQEREELTGSTARKEGPCDSPSPRHSSEAVSAIVQVWNSSGASEMGQAGQQEDKGPQVEAPTQRVKTPAVAVSETSDDAAERGVGDGLELDVRDGSERGGRHPSLASASREQELRQSGQKDRQAPPTVAASMRDQGLHVSTDRPTRLRALRAQVDSLLCTHNSLLSPTAAQSPTGTREKGPSTLSPALPSPSGPLTDQAPIQPTIGQTSAVSLSTAPVRSSDPTLESEAAKQVSTGDPRGGREGATQGGAVAGQTAVRGLCDAEKELAELLSRIDMSGAGDEDGEMDGSEEWIDRALRVERELRAALGILPGGHERKGGEVEGYMAELTAIRSRARAATDGLTQALSGLEGEEREGAEGGTCACGTIGEEGGLEASVSGKRRRTEERGRSLVGEGKER